MSTNEDTSERSTIIAEPVSGIAGPGPRIPLTWWGLVIRAIAGTALILGANVIRPPLQELIVGDAASTEIADMAVTTVFFLLTPVLVIAGVYLWIRFVERMSFRITGIMNGRAILPGVLGGTAVVAVAMAAAWIVLLLAGEGLDPAEFVDGAGDAAAQGAETSVAAVAVLMIIYTFVRAFLLQGLPEELIYRGWFFALTRSRPMFTFWWTTLAFMIIHLTSAGGQQSMAEHFYYLALPLGMGMLAGSVVLWRGSVWWAVGTHGGMHVCLPVATMIAPIDMGMTAWFTVGAAQAILALLILLLWKRGSAG